MQWLTLVSEDNGVQRLKAANRRPAVARALEPVAPYPSAHPARIGEHSETPRRRSENRQPAERRKNGDRRRKQVPVILDTRSQHDRRELQDRHGTHLRKRLDVYA